MERSRILIVDDHDGTRSVLRSIFTRKGWQVTTATTVAEGLESLKTPPDCIVLDLMLPDGRGEAILQKVRADGIPTRMVAVTTGISDSVRLSVVKGMRPDVLLNKPVDLDALVRMCEAELAISTM